MGRPYKEKELLKHVVAARLSDDEMQRLNCATLASGLSKAEVVRRKIAGIVIPHKDRILLIDELKRLLLAINKQGGLIKHCFTENPFDPELTREAIETQNDTIRIIGITLSTIGTETSWGKEGKGYGDTENAGEKDV